MRVCKLEGFNRGWVVGDFPKALIPNKDFEVAVKFYKPKDEEPRHYHKECHEITIVTAGNIEMNGITFPTGSVIEVEPGEIIEFRTQFGATTCVIKTPSRPLDKVLVPTTPSPTAPALVKPPGA